ncbi:P-loop containing nucleoside triphosphate hydrolase protein [Penicillium maclennaniae]|uniref:P-loop containing nucleoside triphosphate hydrolase protein n=1 Tax=Penicillium maclennaniae TaxID=1343394 RepID=UPI002542339B|nr:P-loop containing nucleoside triphosphate hydrolase protein [Penicillium maclennaniae]KAJ5675321.1 P-loop containing nucleoside triphosphate hydrolase protein [Penicillium maclennaniae]
MRDERQHLVETTNITEALQRMTGQPTMQFRGVQGAAIQSIQAGHSRVVVVMPTGGGKSMLFMLPAWRCQAAGIPCVEWDSNRHPDHAAIVFVTPESVFTDGFQSFLNRQRELMRLDRIVIDECHMILNESEKFRPRLQQLGRLHQCGVQMVFLTATLPPCEESRLFQRMQVTREDISMHRERTSRHNVAYRVYRPVIASRYRSQTQWLEDPGVRYFIHERVQRARPGRVIVYGSTKPIVT